MKKKAKPSKAAKMNKSMINHKQVQTKGKKSKQD